MTFFALLILFSSTSWTKSIALISSGGVSLGSYEAGVLREFVTSHQNHLPQDLKVVLGASAGGMNGLLTLFEACRISAPEDEKDLLWKMWIPVGVDQLENNDPTHKSLFHRKPIHALFGEMEKIWFEGFKENCDVIFGVTVTRRNPLIENIRPGLSITRQPEIFLVRIQGRGKNKAPLITNYAKEDKNSYRVTLPLDGSEQENLKRIFDLVQASASFPVAFNPYPLSYCLFRPGEEYQKCSLTKSQTDDFVDGGIYQNSPVGRGYEILKAEHGRSKDLELIYINASAPLKGQKTEDEQVMKDDWGILSEVYGLTVSFLKTSRNMSLSEGLQHFPELTKVAKTNEKNYPLVSEPLYAFLGFIEKDFRISDFYLGQLDGQRMFNSQNKSQGEVACFHEHLVNKDASCSLNKNLTILASLADTRLKSYPQNENLNDIFQFLEKSKFHFKDLGLKRRESKFGRIALKNRLRKLARTLEEKQPEKLRSKTRLLLDQGLNQVSFYPSPNYAYFLFGNSPEIGLSVAHKKHLNIPTRFRFNTSVMMLDYLNKLGSNSSYALAPLIGVRYQPEFLGNSFWQFNVGLRTGYVLSAQDKYGSESCNDEKVKTQVSECSGLIVQQVTSVTFMERLRVQVVYQPDYGNNFGRFLTSNLFFQVGLVFPDIW